MAVAFKCWTSSQASRRVAPARVSSLWPGLALALWTMGTSTSYGAPQDDACFKDPVCKDHYEKGLGFYKEENYEDALTAFQAAYSSRQMSLLLVNIGRTLQRLGRPKDALGYYERYLRAETKPDPEVKKRVETYISEVQALVGEDNKSQPSGPAQPVAPPPEPPLKGRNLMFAGGALAGLGVVGFATGIGLFVGSRSAFNEFTASNNEFEKLDLRNRSQALGSGSTVSYILGAVALGTGAALLGIGGRQMMADKRDRAQKKAGQEKPQALLLPTLDGAQLVVQGGF